MSEPSPTVVAGDAAECQPPALTAEHVAGILADFQAWLTDLTASSEPAPPDITPGPDLFTLLGQLTALRHEVNLHTKSVRAQQEQNAAALTQLTRALASLQQAQASGPAARDESLRPLLQTLVELHDALSVAGREAQRMHDLLTSAWQEAATAPADDLPDPPPSVGLLRWFGWRSRELAAYRAAIAAWRKREQERLSQGQERSERARRLLASLTTGYTMSLQRLERALNQHGLTAIVAVGQAFDPERMEAVEAIIDSGQAPGLVLDEVQRGYLWKGRVFRYARVRVAK